MADTQGAAPQAVDRKELLGQQFDEAEQAAKVETPAPTVAAEPATTATVQAQNGRPRDEAGKFVPKTPAQEKAAALSAAAPVTPVVQALAEEPAWNKPPASWKKEKHPLWSAMTPEQREYAFQREEQMRAGVEPLVPKAELADKLTKAAEPYMNTIRGLGLDLPRAVEGLMRADHDLRTLPHEQRVQKLVQIAAGYGIDLSGQAQQARPSNDPGVLSIQNELLGLKGQFSSLIEQQEAAAQQVAMKEIQKFSQTAEHFEEVKPLMIQLLQGGLAEGIPDAYEKAIRLDPQLFDKVQSAKQAAAETEKRAAADAAAKLAKAARVSVKGAAPGTVKTTTNAQDRRSMLREQLDGISERL